MYLFCMILLIFFAIIGLCSFVTGILNQMSRCSGNAVLVLKELNVENTEARIRSAISICRRHRDIRLICECQHDDPAYEICRLMQAEYPFIEISG